MNCIINNSRLKDIVKLSGAKNSVLVLLTDLLLSDSKIMVGFSFINI